ncbi:MAG: hypothetical protein P8M65_06850 [Roseibacillus sp.]|nr:hypothetical protein [Roseibacillus sp.]
MNKATFNQIISSLATISWGGVPVYLYTRGLIGEYLSESFHVIALSGGLAMIVLGLFNLLHARRQVGCGHDHSHEHDHGHDHDHHEQNPVAAICLMIIPVMLCTGFTKHEYSKEALRWKGLYKQRTLKSLYSTYNTEFTRELLEKRTPKTSEGNFLLQLTELYWSAGDEKIMKIYDGLPAQLEGRLIEEEPTLNPDNTRKRLYRVVMTCCAADAQVLGVPLEFSTSLPALADKTWITARGKVAFELIDGQHFAYLSDCEVEATEPPETQNRRRP